MADLYFKIPKTQSDLYDDTDLVQIDCSANTVSDVHYIIYGFNTGVTEALVCIVNPSTQVAIDVRALTDVTELTEAQYNSEKTNYPS